MSRDDAHPALRIRLSHPASRPRYVYPGDRLVGVVVLNAAQLGDGVPLSLSIEFQGSIVNVDQRSVGLSGSVFYHQTQSLWTRSTGVPRLAEDTLPSHAFPTPPLGPESRHSPPIRKHTLNATLYSSSTDAASVESWHLPFEFHMPNPSTTYLPSAFEGQVSAPSIRYELVAVLKRSRTTSSASSSSLTAPFRSMTLPDVMVIRAVKFRAFIDADSPQFNTPVSDSAFFGPSAMQWLIRGRAMPSSTASQHNSPQLSSTPFVSIEDGLPVSACLFRAACCPGDRIPLRFQFGQDGTPPFQFDTSVTPQPTIHIQLRWIYTSPQKFIGVKKSRFTEKHIVLNRTLSFSEQHPLTSTILIHTPIPVKIPLSENCPPCRKSSSNAGIHRITYQLKATVVIGPLKSTLRLPLVIASRRNTHYYNADNVHTDSVYDSTFFSMHNGDAMREEYLPVYEANSNPPDYPNDVLSDTEEGDFPMTEDLVHCYRP